MLHADWCPHCGSRIATKAVGPNRWRICTNNCRGWIPEQIPTREEKTA